MPNVHQSTALPWPSPLMISGAKYSWVPTKDMDRAAVGSATSSGSNGGPSSGRGFRVFFLVFWGKSRGRKHAGWMHTDVGSIQLGWMQNERDEVLESLELKEEVLISVGETAHWRERSKSDSIMWPSSRTRTFSGLRSR